MQSAVQKSAQIATHCKFEVFKLLLTVHLRPQIAHLSIFEVLVLLIQGLLHYQQYNAATFEVLKFPITVHLKSSNCCSLYIWSPRIAANCSFEVLELLLTVHLKSSNCCSLFIWSARIAAHCSFEVFELLLTVQLKSLYCWSYCKCLAINECAAARTWTLCQLNIRPVLSVCGHSVYICIHVYFHIIYIFTLTCHCYILYYRNVWHLMNFLYITNHLKKVKI